jgi:hypothetical protein
MTTTTTATTDEGEGNQTQEGAVGNQTGDSPLESLTNPLQDLFGGGRSWVNNIFLSSLYPIFIIIL